MAVRILRQEFLDGVKISEIATDSSGVVSDTTLSETAAPSLDSGGDGSTSAPTIDDTDLTYINGVLTVVDEYVSSTLYRKTTLSYTSGVLTSTNVKIYSDGETVSEEYNETMVYTNGILTDVTRVAV